MKTIKIPAPIPLMNPNFPKQTVPTSETDSTPKIMTFSEFVTTRLLADPQWVKDFPHIRAAHNITTLLMDDVVGEVQVEDTDYDKLRKAVESPTNGFQGWLPAFYIQCTPFLIAIVDAK